MGGGWPGSEVQGSLSKSEAGGAEDGCVSMGLAASPPPLVLERRLSSVSPQDPPFLHPPIPLPPAGCGPQVFLFPFFCCHSLPFLLLEDQERITLCSRVHLSLANHLGIRPQFGPTVPTSVSPDCPDGSDALRPGLLTGVNAEWH